MKRKTLLFGRISLWILVVCLFTGGFAGAFADTGMEGEELSAFRKKLKEFISSAPAKASDLLVAARGADGDPLAIFAEAQRYAAELGLARDFAFSTEDAIAEANGSTQWIMAGYDDYWLTDSKKPPFMANVLKAEVDEALASEEARAIVPASLWTDQRFREIYGVSMKDFRPSRPRPGVFLLTLSPSACGWPGMPASDDEKALKYAIDDVRKMLERLSYTFEHSHSAMKVTGNPDTASVFIEMDIQFVFSGEYKNNYQGYDLVIRLTALDASTRKKIADSTAKSEIGYMVTLGDGNHHNHYVWASFPKWYDEPSDRNTASYKRFISELERYIAKAVKAWDTTPEPYGALPALLEEESGKTRDPWLKAVLSSGARDFRIRDGMLSFTLRSGNPRTDTLAEETGDPAAFLTHAGQNALAHDLTVTVALQDGFIGKKTRQDILAAAKRAAADSKKAFSGKEIAEAFRQVYFPAPSGKFKKAEDIAEAASAMPESAFHYPYDDPAAAAVRFYGMKKCTLDVSGGPDGLALTVTGLTRETLVIPLSLEDLARSGFSEAYEAMLQAN